MNTMKPTLLTIIICSLLLASCSAGNKNANVETATVVAATQTAMVPGNSSPMPTAAPYEEYQPISEKECSDLKTSLSEQIGLPGTITSREPFEDYKNNKVGFGCKISLTTDGADANHDLLGELVPSTLETDGWVKDESYTFPGTGGLASAYRKGDQLCLTVSYVEPWEDTLCQENEDLFACLDRLPSEQIRYGFDLNCAVPLP